MSTIRLHFDTEDLAEHYERLSANRQFVFGQHLIKAIGVAPGQKVLDVGSGTGLLAEYVADIVGSSGAVVGVDPLPLRIQVAKRKARHNLSFQVANANDLTAFDEAGFDVVYLNAVFHWIADKAGALLQFQRVLKQGGRLGIATGNKEHENVLQTIKARVLSRAPYNQYPEALDGESNRVSLIELANLLDQTGFSVEKIELVPQIFHHPDPETAITFHESSSFGNFLGNLPEGLRAQARAEIAAELELLRTDEGVIHSNTRISAVAVKR
jgi:ubiquinone/menaquinone biosynthesis C-methylase UbiE